MSLILNHSVFTLIKKYSEKHDTKNNFIKISNFPSSYIFMKYSPINERINIIKQEVAIEYKKFESTFILRRLPLNKKVAPKIYVAHMENI